ncbi:para-aminobenzoate synthetase component 1 [Psychrobacter sp. PL19]|uniref:anthranilate synthase component I family protein n=1 Tax=Psychrobacter sp. PL19 TaxID=2760711 RepID=UPI001AE4554A
MANPIARHDSINPANVKSNQPVDQAPLKRPLQWGFGGLSAAELLPLLQQHLATQDPSAQWQLVWLNNDGQSVVGLLPKVSWAVYFHGNNHHTSDLSSMTTQRSNDQIPNYKVIKNCRDDGNAITTAYMSYLDWQNELINYSQAHEIGNSDANLINDQDENPSYHHGLIGFIGYDIAAHELSPASQVQQTSQPCATMGHYDLYLTPINDPTNSTTRWILKVETGHTDLRNTAENKFITALISYLDTLDNTLSTSDSDSDSDNANQAALKIRSTLRPLVLSAQWSKLDYQQAFEQTQNYLQQGDCYQINLTQAWGGQFVNSRSSNHATVTSLIDYLPALHHNTQAPFAGYLGVNRLENSLSKHSPAENSNLAADHARIHNRSDQPSLDFELLSCSPELFFTFIKDVKTGRHHIRTKPIKGTIPRGINAEQDLVLKQQLTDSDKDRAENVMIVDLLRNDLGKYAKTGSVKVPQLFTIESFSNVHHMVSTITAELKEDTHPLAVLFGSLPAGSITGTPKKRAVEIISELEAAPRGAYCGTMGYMNFDGSGQWNVLIRTLQADTSSSPTGQVNLWAGGGITIASDSEAEYQECLDKVGNLLNVLTQDNWVKKV